jgi:predicted acylesterase/phospholipase RssA
MDSTMKEKALEILKNKTALAISGGGVLSIGHVGQLDRWIELGGNLNNIKHLSTSSGGSIIGAAIACGASLDFIKNTMFSMDYNSLKDRTCLLVDINRFLTHGGWYIGEELIEYVHNMLETLTGNGNITFKEAYNRYGINLTMNYVSLRYRTTRYANHITKPNSSIKKYVRASSGYPFFFKLLQDEVIDNNMIKSDLLLDGGIVDNFPMHVLHEMGIPKSKILGLTLVSPEEDASYMKDFKGELWDYGLPQGPLDLAVTLIGILRNTAMKLHIQDEDWKITSKTNVGKYTSMNFNITKTDASILYEAGKKGMDKHLELITKLVSDNTF